MKIKQLCIQTFFVVGVAATITFSQTIPDDPNHLPTKIGGDPGSRAGSIMVAGKVTLVGIPAGQPKPAIYVPAYFKGSFVGRRHVSENGSSDQHLPLAALYNAAGVKDRAAAKYKLFLAKKPDYPDK